MVLLLLQTHLLRFFGDKSLEKIFKKEKRKVENTTKKHPTSSPNQTNQTDAACASSYLSKRRQVFGVGGSKELSTLQTSKVNICVDELIYIYMGIYIHAYLSKMEVQIMYL